MMFACSGTVSAQNDLGSFLGNLIQSASQNRGDKHNDDKDKKGSFFDDLANIFSNSKVAKEKQLVGTWKYSGPAVLFETENMLQGIGGKLAAKKMEERIQHIMDKYGLQKEHMTVQFDNDGQFTQFYKKMKFSGTYKVEDKNVVLKYQGKYDPLMGRTQIDGKSLVIVMDVDKLNDYLVNITSSSKDSRVQALSRLLSGIKGVSVGMRFSKE